MSPRLCIVVPAYNEEEGIDAAVAQIRAAALGLHVPFEIVVVDDASSDGTAAHLAAIAAGASDVRAVRHETNLGIAGAVRTGARAATADLVLIVPVDSPLTTVEMQGLLRAAGDGIAVGYREERAGYASWMRLAARVYHGLLCRAFRIRLRDLNWCCLYPRAVLLGLPHRFDGVLGLPEILIRANRAGVRLTEVPVGMRPRTTGRATARRLGTMLTTVVNLGRLFVELELKGR
jgi:glycosyltransferase involved in cell wall biosynthesis